MGIVNAPSSLSSKPSEKKLEKGSTLASYPFGTFHRSFHGMLLEESGKEQATVIRRVLDVPERGTASAYLEVAVASPNPGPVSAVLKGTRKADDVKNRPESPAAETNRGKAAISESEKAYKDFWLNRKQKIFRDPPGSSGRLGPCMQILAVEGVEPMDTPFVTFQTAGFSLDTTGQAGGTIISFMDEHLMSDPDRLGSGRLDVFLRTNIEEINFHSG